MEKEAERMMSRYILTVCSPHDVYIVHLWQTHGH